MKEDTAPIRSAYKTFMESPGGKHLLEHLLTLEATAQAEGRSSKTVEGKGLAMTKLNSAYDLRTHFADWSKPAPATAVRSVSPK